MRSFIKISGVSLLVLSSNVFAQVDMGSISYSALASADGVDIPILPFWALTILGAVLAAFGAFTLRRHKVWAKSLFALISATSILAVTVSGLQVSSVEAQAPNYECPDVAVSGTVNITDASTGSADLEYDPSEAIEECGAYIGANYAGPGTLTMTTSLTFTLTNSTGAALQLDAAEFATDPINTSIDDFVLGANTVDYTDMVVTPSDGDSECGNSLEDGVSCEITMEADTTGTLAVT